MSANPYDCFHDRETYQCPECGVCMGCEEHQPCADEPADDLTCRGCGDLIDGDPQERGAYCAQCERENYREWRAEQAADR